MRLGREIEPIIERFLTGRPVMYPVARGAVKLHGAIREIDERVQRDVDAAVKFADESPYPSVEAFMSDLYNYVYAPSDASTDVHEKGE